jgi:hypothetical protein
MMSTEEREQRRSRYLAAVTAVSKELHGCEFRELPSGAGVEVVRAVFRRHPELRDTFDEPYEPLSEHAAVHDVPVDLDQLREPGRQADVRRRYNFSVEDVQHDPLKQSLGAHVARHEQRANTQDEFNVVLQEIGRKHGLDPSVYAERLKIGEIMVRQRHKLAERA